jgi:AbrB family looped-hinge helix DNA binding protein
MKTVLSVKGQLVLPAAIRAADELEPGTQFEVERVAAGEYRLTRIAEPRLGLVEWLQQCPDPDYFQRVPSESTDDL